MFTVCIILIVIIVIIKSLGGNRCPKCGSTNIATVDDGSPVETGCVAVLLAFFNPGLAAKGMAKSTHYRCRNCGHKF